MNSNPIRYQHTHIDPVHDDGRVVKISAHADPRIAMISVADARHPTESIYMDADHAASAVVALFASTQFTSIDPSQLDINGISNPTTVERLQEIATQFIDVFREAMIPSFRQEFEKALALATDDWDAKCRVSDIINRYENLR